MLFLGGLQKNQDLQRENCDLASQRDELVKKCKEYQQEIEQHKHQGCMVPHFSPPYDLEQILNPATPPSPSFSGSGNSASPCPSPVPNITPGLPLMPMQQAYHTDLAPSTQTHCSVGIPNVVGSGVDGMPRGPTPGAMTLGMMPIITTAGGSLASAETPQVHYIKVRNKDGSSKTLVLAHDDYLKVKEKVKTTTPPTPPRQREQPPAETITSASQLQEMQFMSQMDKFQLSSPLVETPALQPIQVEPVQEPAQNTGQKIDTFDDLISVLQNTVKGSDSERQFELIPVNPNDVLVKQEPMDTGYEQQSFAPMKTDQEMAVVKKEEIDLTGPWVSTGEQIRAGMDLTNDDELTSSAQIQNLVNFLEESDDNVLTVTVTDPITSEVLEQTTTKSPPLQPARHHAGKMTTDSNSTLGQCMTYVTSSAAVGSLSMNKADVMGGQLPLLPQSVFIKPSMSMHNGVNSGLEYQSRTMSVSAMQNIKLRPHTSQLMHPPRPQMTGRQATAMASQRGWPVGLQGQRTNILQNGMNVTVAAPKVYKEAKKKIMRNITSSFKGASGKPSQAGQQLQNLQQMPSTFLQQNEPASVTSAMAVVQQQFTDELLSASTSQILEYLTASSIESMDA